MQTTQERYDTLYETMEFLDGKHSDSVEIADQIKRNQFRYKAAVSGTPVPWYVLALIHQMEADGDFRKQVVNGEPFDRTTRLYPKGKGPWTTWESAALWALQKSEDFQLFNKTEWPRWKTLYRLECYNGVGYQNKGLPSPYLWAGSNHGAGVGKFVERLGSDGEYHATYDPTLMSNQIGAALIYKVLMEG